MSTLGSQNFLQWGGVRSSHSSLLIGAPVILICLLGRFQVLKGGHPLRVGGRKSEALLRTLAFRPPYSVSRDELISVLWPNAAPKMAGQSLSTLVYGLRRTFGDTLGGAAPVLRAESGCRLNVEAGVGVDVALFDHFASEGDERLRSKHYAEAMAFYHAARDLYRGDLCDAPDADTVIERERLRARYLTVLVRLADLACDGGDYRAALRYALLLLAHDPCREDAHRMAMRCYVKLGERVQSLRQYRLCEQVLQAEFDVIPEAATKALYDQIRSHPELL